MNLYGYARISKEHIGPDEKSESPEHQEAIIRDRAAETPYQYVHTFREPGGVSAVNVPHTKRKAFKELLQIVEPGDAVMVTALSRFERKALRQLRAVELLCVNRQVAVYSLLEFKLDPIDLDNMTHLLQLLLHSYMDQHHSYTIGVKMRDVHKVLRAQGRKTGPCPRFGYRLVEREHPTEPGKLVWFEEPDPKQAAICLEIWLRRKHGETWSQIATYLDRQGHRRWNGKAWTTERWYKGKLRKTYEAVRKPYQAIEEAIARGEKSFAGLPIPEVKSSWLTVWPLGVYA